MRRQLIVVFGVPGVGKTTLAKALANELHCFRFDKDFISDTFRSLNRDTPEDRSVAYQIIDAAIRGALADANRIIVEAPLMAQLGLPKGAVGKQPDHFAALARELDAEFKPIQLWCAEDTLRERIVRRGLDRDKDKVGEKAFREFLIKQPLRISQESGVLSTFDVCEICSDLTPELQLKQALAYIHSGPGPISRMGKSLEYSFGYKRPLRHGKRGQFSLALWLFARLFWLHRIIAPIQWTKFVARMWFLDRPEDDIPPLVAEIFTLVPIGALFSNIYCLESGKFSLEVPYLPLVVILCWRVIDVVMGNLYYLLLRPMVEINPPHNSYRSFLLGWLGFLEICLLLATVWYYVGIYHAAYPNFSEIIGQVLKGGEGIPELVAVHGALDIFAKVSFGVMLTIVLGRAVSLVPPLPIEGQAQSPASR